VLAVPNPDRLLFGSDSSFFPRGWVRGVYDQQAAALDRPAVSAESKGKIFGGTFDRLFGAPQGPCVVTKRGDDRQIRACS